MLYGAHLDITLGNDGATLCADYIFGHRIDHGFAFKVDTLEFVTCVFGCREESSLNDSTGVEAFTADAERRFECYLLHMVGLD